MEKQDIIIVGAGISGLSLAHYCAQAGLKTLVLEKSDRTGGTFHSHRIGSGSDDFWLELGAHTCYNSYGNFIKLMDECHALEKITGRAKVSFKMLIGNRIKSIPSQLNYMELLLSAPRLMGLKKEGLSIESYYSRIVGRKNFERVFRPAFNAVICQESGHFPADMLFQKRPRRKDIIKQYTFRDGLQTATDALASQKSIVIKKGVPVEDIAFDGTLFSVATPGESFESSHFAVAAPASAAAVLLRSAFPDISGLLARIEVATVSSVGVVIRKDAVNLDAVAGLIPADDIFYSVVSRDTVPHNLYRGFTFHFKPGALKREAKLERISEVLGLRVSQLEFVAERENFVPSLRVGHPEIIAKVERLLAGKPLLLAGNYFSGVAIEDCVARSSNEFQRLQMKFRA